MNTLTFLEEHFWALWWLAPVLGFSFCCAIAEWRR